VSLKFTNPNHNITLSHRNDMDSRNGVADSKWPRLREGQGSSTQWEGAVFWVST